MANEKTALVTTSSLPRSSAHNYGMESSSSPSKPKASENNEMAGRNRALETTKSPPLASLQRNKMESGSSDGDQNLLEADSTSGSVDVFDEGLTAESDTFYQKLKPRERREMQMADRLSRRLLAARGDSLEEDQILEETLQLVTPPPSARRDSIHRGSLRRASLGGSLRSTGRFRNMLDDALEEQGKAETKLKWMGVVVLILVVGVSIIVGYGAIVVFETRPPLQPVGPYRLIELQEGTKFLDSYTFYVGKDSAGSNGFNYYVDQPTAVELGIINITMEQDELNLLIPPKVNSQDQTGGSNRRTTPMNERESDLRSHGEIKDGTLDSSRPFVYVGSTPTEAGPRNSIRLEGNRRFDRGLFILDVRRMPAGCGVWPAFWLVDELNWPVNGEIFPLQFAMRVVYG